VKCRRAACRLVHCDRSCTCFAGSILEMGARQHSPLLGRFLEVEPIEGGTPNNHVYPTDPVSQFDLDGRICGTKGIWGWRSCHWGEYAAGFVNVYLGVGKISAGAAMLAATDGVPTPGPLWSLGTGTGRVVRGFRQGFRVATSPCSGDCSVRRHATDFFWGVVPLGGFIRRHKSDWIDKWGSY
jgi:hypothetical protein